MESPMFYKFHTREYLSFSDRSIQIIGRYNPDELGIKEPVVRVNSAHEKLGGALTKAVSTELTADVVHAEAGRDNAFYSTKHYLQACQKYHDPKWSEAADLLVARVKHYGWSMQDESYNKQSALTMNLLNDVEQVAEFSEAVSIIQGKRWFDGLKKAQTNFEQSLEVRTQAKASQVKINSDEACKELRQAYESLFTFIDALQLVAPMDARKPLIDEINTVIKEYNVNIKSRLSRLEIDNEE